jgi:hypothetical protein
MRSPALRVDAPGRPGAARRAPCDAPKRPVSAVLAVMAASALSFGCAALYPELTTPLRAPLAAQQLEPPPPAGLYWIAIKEGTAPEKTRDGRAWHELGNKLPDPFAILFVNGKELIRTNPESGSLHPVWADAPRGNFRIERSDRVRVELWQAGLVQKPMCVREMSADPEEWLISKQLKVSCDGGAEVVVAWEPAHGQVGYGFYYELRTADVYVTRVFEESPASHAGLRPGDQLTKLGDRQTTGMNPGEIQSYFNAPKSEGIQLEVRHSDKSVAELSIKEGAVYPLFSEAGSTP